MLKKIQDLGLILLYLIIGAAVFAGVVLSTLANLGFRWGPNS